MKLKFVNDCRPVERDQLDKANDEDDDTDDRFSINDGRARVIELTQETDQPDELAARQRIIRQVGLETGADNYGSVEDVEEAYNGNNDVLGELSTTDQGALLDGFVDGLNQTAEHHPQGLIYVPPLAIPICRPGYSTAARTAQ